MFIQCAVIIVILYSGKSIIFSKHYSAVSVAFAVLTVVTWALYWKAALQGPGYVTANSIKVDSDPASQEEPNHFLQNIAPSTLQ